MSLSQPFLASFTGTAVEFFETAAIAYAIVHAGYPREALSAVVLGHVLVFAAAVILFPLHEVFPVFWLRLLAAVSLTAMGLHWTIKSVRRLYSHERPYWAEDPLGKVGVTPGARAAAAFSPFVFLVMGKSSVVEASEILLVVFPVAAATAAWSEVIWGVAAGITAVSLAMLVLHGQLRKIPEVKLKLVVGLILLTLGASWLYEIYRDHGA